MNPKDLYVKFDRFFIENYKDSNTKFEGGRYAATIYGLCDAIKNGEGRTFKELKLSRDFFETGEFKMRETDQWDDYVMNFYRHYYDALHNVNYYTYYRVYDKV